MFRYKRISTLATVALIFVPFFVLKLEYSALFLEKLPIVQLNEAAPYYLVNKEWVSEHSRVLGIDAFQSLKFDTSVKEIVALMQETKEGYFLELQTSIKEQYESIFREQLNAQLADEIRDGMCMEADPINGALEVATSKYVEKYGEKIRNGILQDIVKDTTDSKLKKKINAMQSVKTERSKYFQTIFKDIILRYGPQENGGLESGNDFWGQSANNHNFLYSKEFLTKDRIMASEEKVAELKHKHKLLVEAIRKIPIPSLDLFKGDGIVLAASPEHFTGALNIIVQAREMGSKLPVELIMDSKMDYNKQLCEDTLPQLNGRCLIIEEVIGLEAFYKRKLDGFQYKALAILVSSFDNTIFLDSDSFPIKNVDTLLKSNSFQKTKFVMWRDFWHKSTSPLFYEIAGIKTGEIAHRHGSLNEEPFSLYIAKNVDTEVLFHDLDGLPSMYTVESGQMVFSKREHFRSLVLACYYNYYGVMYYYQLIYQGNFGAGDKDTFVPALHIMKEPYTITEYPALSGGNKSPANNDDGFDIDETTMVQVDPDEAASHQEKWREWLRKQNMDKRLNLCQQGAFTRELRTQFYLTIEGSDGKVPTAFFLHVHNPKINSFSNENPKLRSYDFKHRFIRAIGDFQDLMGPVDWELKFHSINAWVTCVGLNDRNFWAEHDLNLDEICKKAKGYVKVLKESSNDESAAHLNSIQNWDK